VNAITDGKDRVDPAEWERPEMRSALAVRDICRVYRLLQKIGFSQQRIAALAGQSQPEVSAIIHGRHVQAYDVLSRIADGLGVPREYMGLSYEAMPAGAGVGGESSSGRRLRGAASEEDDPVQRRDFLGATGAVLGGANALAYERWLPRAAAHAAPPPARIGVSDVARVRRTTDLLHNLGTHQLGGHATLDAVTGYLRSTSALLRSSCTEAVGRQLKVALADLAGVAAYAMHDVGRYWEAHRHYLQGLVLARDAGEHALVAHLLRRMGQVYLDGEHALEALQMFQFAEPAAQDAGSHAELTSLHQNEALAYALLGQSTQVADALARAEHERGLMAGTLFPEAASFHGSAQFNATARGEGDYFAAWAYALLGRHHGLATRSGERAARISQQLLDPAVADTRPGVSRAFDQTLFAAGLLHSGERDAGIAAAHEAVSQVQALRSARAVVRLRLITDATKPWQRTPTGLELRRRIAATHAV
jgi:transcriptional regulator with XRE-family HTH domain